MAQTALSHSKIPTKSPQLSLAEGGGVAPARARARRAAPGVALVSGDRREGTRGEGRVVVEVAGGSRCTRPGVRGTGGGRCGTRMGSAASASR